jgi:hypothetical protein
MTKEQKMTKKFISKMYRMKMMTEVRDFVKNVPFDIIEKQVDNSIYTGIGEVRTGTKSFLTEIQIIKKENGVRVVLHSPEAGIQEDVPFGTKEQMEEATKMIRKIKEKFVN